MGFQAKKTKEPLVVGEIELALSQIRSDGVAVYRPIPAGGQLFGIGDVVVGKGFLPNDIDFNLSFIGAATDDKAIMAKQKEFAKYLRLKVKIEM